MKIFLISLVTLLTFNACQKADDTKVKDDFTIEFKGRQINLSPYFEGFPYSDYIPSYTAGKIFYFKEGEERILHFIDLANEPDFSNGTAISDIDFAKRNTWNIKYNNEDNSLYWSGDEANDEVMNIYKLSLDDSTTTKLTKVPYLYAYNWDKDKTKIAYTARLGVKEDRLGELRIMELTNYTEQAIIQDIPQLRFIWGNISFSPDGSKVIIPAVKNADRNWGNLVMVDLENPELILLTDSTVTRRSVEAYSKWLNDNEFIYTSNENGFVNLYKYNIANKKNAQLTNFDTDISSYQFLELNEEVVILAVVQNPIVNFLYVINPTSGDILYNESVEMNFDLKDSKDNKAIAQTNSATVMFQMQELTWTGSTLQYSVIAKLPDELNSKITHTKVERVEFPTFDLDPNTGKTRMLHGYLFIPDNPLPKGEEIVLVHSFYGGSNAFSVRTQIMADAGIYVFSPAPRGSTGFGAEFSALNDRDLGGNEIIDVIYAGQYISERLKVPAKRIGVFGGSHGGYASMRLLTFPGEINGNQAQFDWGFGISHAGFSDIIHFYENCNIPDWVILEAGDPATEAEKLNSRSPLYSAENMNSRLLLLHGSNDMRVPVEGSRWMADSLTKYNKSFEFVEFEGQGHSIKGLANNVTFYKAWLDFLSKQ